MIQNPKVKRQTVKMQISLFCHPAIPFPPYRHSCFVMSSWRHTCVHKLKYYKETGPSTPLNYLV